MRQKSLVTALVTSAAAAATVIAATAGVTSISSSSASMSGMSENASVQLAVLGIPFALDPADVAPAADVPSPEVLQNLLTSIGNPSVPFHAKSDLIEGGVGIIEGHAADRAVAKAVAKGGVFPLSFAVADIAPAGPGAATANVTATSAGGTPTTEPVTFVDQGGWKLSKSSALSLLQAASG